jgi:hypothetical protein
MEHLFKPVMTVVLAVAVAVASMARLVALSRCTEMNM